MRAAPWFGKCKLLLLLGAVSVAQAHQAIETQILGLDRQIQNTPTDLSLYLRRADLYRRHRAWQQALSDFAHVEQRQPTHFAALTGRAQLELDRGSPRQSLRILADVVRHHPNEPAAHLMRGRALRALNKGEEAAQAFTLGIGLSRKPLPDHYLERAAALASDPQRINEAILSIDQGLEQLGNLVSLESFALELEMRIGDYAAALARTEGVLRRNAGITSWLVTRAEVLTCLNRDEDAQRASRAALAEISQLPARRQRSKAIMTLKARLSRLGVGFMRMQGAHTDVARPISRPILGETSVCPDQGGSKP